MNLQKSTLEEKPQGHCAHWATLKTPLHTSPLRAEQKGACKAHGDLRLNLRVSLETILFPRGFCLGTDFALESQAHPHIPALSRPTSSLGFCKRPFLAVSSLRTSILCIPRLLSFTPLLFPQSASLSQGPQTGVPLTLARAEHV